MRKSLVRQFIRLLINTVCLALACQPLSGRSHEEDHLAGQTTRALRGRALFVGIDNYQAPGVSPTAGGEADARAMSQLALEKGWFKPEEIRTLLGSEATSSNIEKEFVRWLINDSKPGDQILFFYSGHGTQTDDIDGDETEDQRDEAIAPYDAYGTNGKYFNIITDDKFNEWIEKLGGRSIVLIFDSCHSGTVTRSVGNPDSSGTALGPRYFSGSSAMNTGSRTRSMGDQISYKFADGPITRNLNLVMDKTRQVQNSLVTLISASGSYQLAYPLMTPERKVRGALTYFLEEGLKRTQTVSQLYKYVKENIKKAQSEKILTGTQVPHFEMSAVSQISSKPLLQSSKSNDAAELDAIFGEGIVNSNSRIRITAEVGKVDGKRLLTNITKFCLNDKIGYRITTDTPGYIFMVAVSQNNEAKIIYPFDDQEFKIDRQLDLFDQFEVTPPVGKDVVVVFLTKRKLDLSNLYGRSFTWDELKSLLWDKRIELSPRTRGVTNKNDQNTLSQADWQAVRVESEAAICSGS